MPKCYVCLSQKYPPATRALIGALLDEARIYHFKEALQKKPEFNNQL